MCLYFCADDFDDEEPNVPERHRLPVRLPAESQPQQTPHRGCHGHQDVHQDHKVPVRMPSHRASRGHHVDVIQTDAPRVHRQQEGAFSLQGHGGCPGCGSQGDATWHARV